VDLCILCGCDYTVNITGVGPVKAFNFIRDQRSIEKVIAKILDDQDNKKKRKYNIPDAFYYKEARALFNNPEINADKAAIQEQLKWNKPFEEDLINFMVKQKGFNEGKVDSGISRLKKCVGKTNQARLDCFFKSGGTKTSSSAKKENSGGKTQSMNHAFFKKSGGGTMT